MKEATGIKAHVMTGVNSSVITAIKVTDAGTRGSWNEPKESGYTGSKHNHA
jgi:hypothetical protein